MAEAEKPNWLERLSHFLLREPDDREQLVELLHASFEKSLLDADALAMIEGVLQVSETQVRDVNRCHPPAGSGRGGACGAGRLRHCPGRRRRSLASGRRARSPLQR